MTAETNSCLKILERRVDVWLQILKTMIVCGTTRKDFMVIRTDIKQCSVQLQTPKSCSWQRKDWNCENQSSLACLLESHTVFWLSHITISFQALLGLCCHTRCEDCNRWIYGRQVLVESCFYEKETEEFSKLKKGTSAGLRVLLFPKVWVSFLGPRQKTWTRIGLMQES